MPANSAYNRGKTDRERRTSVYLGLLDSMRIKEQNKRNKETQLALERKKEAAKNKIQNIFDSAYSSILSKRLKKTPWQAAVAIQRWFKRQIHRVREKELKRWLPTDLDLENASYHDVVKILKVLDDYSFKSLSVIDNEPTLPFVVKIQRFVKSYLRASRVKRVVRDILKLNRFVKTLGKIRDRKLTTKPFRVVQGDIRQEKEAIERMDREREDNI